MIIEVFTRLTLNAKIVRPGDQVDVDDFVAKSLIERKFARKIVSSKADDEVEGKQVPEGDKAGANPAENVAEGTLPDDQLEALQEYMKLTLDELRDIARDNEVNLEGATKKRDIAQILVEWEFSQLEE